MREPTVNDHSLNDPKLQTFEARLSAMSPQISAKEQQHLLYQCAFAVGRRAGRRSLRRWQASTVALVLLSLGTAVPFIQNRWTPTRQLAESNAPTEVRPQLKLIRQRAAAPRQTSAIALDAWQMPHSAQSAFDSTHAAHIDPSVRSLTVTGLIRAMQTP